MSQLQRRIGQLVQNADYAALETLLDSTDFDLLQSLYEDRVQGGDPYEILTRLFLGSPVTSESGRQRRLSLFKLTMGVLCAGELTDKISAKLVSFLVGELDVFDKPDLAAVAHMVVTSPFKAGRCENVLVLEFLPKCLAQLKEASEVVNPDPEQGGQGKFSGKEYVDHILNAVLTAKWKDDHIVQLASTLRELDAPEEQNRRFLKKITGFLASTDTGKLPPLVYQLLLFAKKGHRLFVLSKITDFFNDLDDRFRKEAASKGNASGANEIESAEDQEKELRQVEGSAILHFNFSFKQDQDLGNAFLKLFKTQGRLSFKPFTLALMFSLAHTHRYEEKALDTLRAAIITTFRDIELVEKAEWLSAVLPLKEVVLETVFDELIIHCKSGWEHVTQSLVHLGVILIDSASKVAVDKATEKASILGERILLETFKAHEMVRPAILEQIFTRVVTKSASATNFIRLLRDIVESCLHEVLPFLPKLKEALDYLSFLPSKSAEGLLDAVNPIISINTSFRDHLALVLRKAMFSKETEGRMISMTGFMKFLKEDPQQGSSTPQQLNAQHLEILNNLRRSLSQQIEIKSKLYQQFYWLIRSSPALCLSVFEVLVPHVMGFLEDDTVLCPYKLEKLFESGGSKLELSEPLPSLLMTAMHCVLVHQDDSRAKGSKPSPRITEFREIFDSSIDRLRRCSLEDLGLDKSADYSATSNVGLGNAWKAWTLLRVHEVIIEYIFYTEGLTIDSSQAILNVFHLGDDLREALKKGSGKKKVEPLPSVLTLTCVVSLTSALFGDPTCSKEQGRDNLSEDEQIIRYFVQLALNGVQALARGELDFDEKNYQNCKTLATVLFTEFVNAGESRRENDIIGRDKAKSAYSLAVECFTTTVQIVHENYPAKMLNFFKTVISVKGDSDSQDEADQDQLLFKRVKCLMIITKQLITDTAQSLKEATLILGAMRQVLSHIGAGKSPYTGQVLKWLVKISEEQNIDDLGLTKNLVVFLFSLLKTGDDIVILADFTEGVRYLLGAMGDEEDESQCRFSLVNNKNCSLISSCVFQAVEKELDVLDWALVQMRRLLDLEQELLVGDDSEGLGKDVVEILTNAESAVLGRYLIIAGVLTTSTSTNIAGVTSEAMLKTVTNWWKSLTNLVKYKLAEKGEISKAFHKLMEVTGNFTKAISFYLQHWQSSTIPEAGDKKGKKRKKVDSGLKARILRESKLVPNLVYVMEMFDRHLVMLANQSKEKLMSNFVRLAARDFRISHQEMARQIQDDLEVGSDYGDDDDDDGDGAPKKKKKKKAVKEEKLKQEMMDDEIHEEDEQVDDAPPESPLMD